jgi:hypothetical protein
MNENRFGNFLFIAIAIILLHSGTSAGSARLSGRVSNKKGEGIRGLTVRAEQVATGRVYDTMTIDDGYYELMVETAVKDKSAAVPEAFSLTQNYPNPFNPTTSFEYAIPRTSEVRIEVFDVLGRRVRGLVQGRKEPGIYTGRWDGFNEYGTGMAGGIYLIRMDAGSFMSVRKWVKLDGTYSGAGNEFHSIQKVEMSSENTVGKEIFNISFTKENEYSPATVTNYAIDSDEKTLDMTLNMIPRVNMNGDITTYPNATVVVETGSQIDDDDPLESLVISSGEGDARTEIKGVEGNQKLSIKLIDNFIGRKGISIKVSDGTATAQKMFDITAEGNLFQSQAVNFEDMQAVTDTLHIIAENLDKSDTTEYHVISTDGNLRLFVKPGKYNIYIRDELEHFDSNFDPLTKFATRELFEQNKYEYLKLGKWYDRRLDNVDLRQDANYPVQVMIGEELDLSFDENLGYPYLHSAKILSKFDYPSFFWMSAGFRKGQNAYPYAYTGQGDSELKIPLARWQAMARGGKIHVIRNKTGRPYGEEAANIASYKNETSNMHAIETYFQAEKEILDGLNPDWFEYLDQYDGNANHTMCFVYLPGWETKIESIRYQPDYPAITETNLNIQHDLMQKYSYPSQEAEAEDLVKRHVMGNIMGMMGLPGRLSDWPRYGNPYLQFPGLGIIRAAGLIIAGKTYECIPSSWEKRDRAAIFYFYSLPEENRDNTHVLID